MRSQCRLPSISQMLSPPINAVEAAMHHKRLLESEAPEPSTSAAPVPPAKKAKAPAKATTSRKAQHSGPCRAESNSLTGAEIERRRRTKINDCLSILENSVPACRQEVSRQRSTSGTSSSGRGSRPARRSSRRPGEALDDGSPNQDDQTITPTEDPNAAAFTPQSGAQSLTLSKLEILECTVEYLRELELRALAAESALYHLQQNTVVTTAGSSVVPSPALAPQSQRLAPPLPEEGDAAATLLSFASPDALRPTQREDSITGVKI